MSAPRHDTAMTFEHAASMGLSEEEWDLILKRIGRTPNLCELGIFPPCGRSIVPINPQSCG